jgi:hypothetical protein
MKRRRRVAAVVLIGAMVLCGSVVRASAQDAPPDLRMLMNLDLFEPRHNAAKTAPTAGASPADDSMLDQIRTLDAMGYLGNHGDNPAGAEAGDIPPSRAVEAPRATQRPETQSTPASQPSYDAEGPSP